MFTAVVTALGGATVEITPQQESLKYTTAAVGGFGSCSFTLLGDRRRDVPKLATVRVYLDTVLAWEGRVEDHGIAPVDDPVTTSVTAYGLQRRLTDVSVRRIWSKRDIPWHTLPVGLGGAIGAGATRGNLALSIGAFDPADPTRQGIQAAGNGVAVGAGSGEMAELVLPAGLTAQRLLATATLIGTNTGASGLVAQYFFSTDGTTWSASFFTTTQDVNVLIANAINLRLGALAVSGVTPTATDMVQWSNLRVLGTALQEDAAGGFYGGSILTDLLALVPGLTVGIIEAGSDYTIPSIERAVRDTSLSVVNEVAGYYNREWAVWENGAFSWTTPNLDEPQWIIPLEQMLPGTRMETSIDTLASQVYVLFSEALDGKTAEQTSPALDARNPLVRASLTKDELLQAPTVMTDNTSAQLAAIEAARQVYPPVSGTIVLNATSLIQNAVSAAKPAALIRAGTNVYLPGMPKTDSVLAPPGRDGETLFHIVTTEVDMEAGTVTLELEGQAREIDVITARLAASTRVVTG